MSWELGGKAGQATAFAQRQNLIEALDCVFPVPFLSFHFLSDHLTKNGETKNRSSFGDSDPVALPQHSKYRQTAHLNSVLIDSVFFRDLSSLQGNASNVHAFFTNPCRLVAYRLTALRPTDSGELLRVAPSAD